MVRHPAQRSMFHGVIGGLVAATVVAAWFLVYDLMVSEAFWTPARLASVMLREEFLWPTARLVVTYSVLHFGVFAVLGAITAWFLESVAVTPGLMVGAVFGIGVLNGVHYGGLLITDTDLLTVLPVGHVLAVNLVAGMALMTYLHRALHPETPLGWRVLEQHPLLLKGFATGLWGAAAVALWFLLIDIMTSSPFYTPAALGSALFLGVSSAADVSYSVGIVAAYTFVHILAFMIVGVGFVWAAERIERAPGLWLLALMAFVVLEGLFVATAGIVSEWVLGALGWGAVVVGNLVAVGVMGWWVWQTHPQLQQRFSGQPVETRV